MFKTEHMGELSKEEEEGVNGCIGLLSFKLIALAVLVDLALNSFTK